MDLQLQPGTASDARQALKRAATASICHTCFAEIPAVVEERDDGALYIVKTCRAHGVSEAMAERDAEFCREAMRHKGRRWGNSPVTVIEITHRCNNRCPNCYHDEDRGHQEPTIEEIEARVASLANHWICFVGGEPTVRSDLPEIIRRVTAQGRQVSMYTNGIRFAEPGYAEKLAEAGLVSVAFSMHHREYSEPSIYAKKLRGFANLAASKVLIGHASFSLQHDGQVPGILDFIESNFFGVEHFRIRSAYEPEHVPWFVSDLYKLVKTEADRRGKTFEFRRDSDNDRYEVCFLYDGIPIWLMSWPSDRAIDLHDARAFPKACFTDGVEVNFLRAVCIQNGLRLGWFAGRRVDPGPGRA